MPNANPKSEPNWPSLNFHQVMVLICDTFQMNHQQMVSLRSKLEQVYGKQKDVSIKALAIMAYRRLDAHPDKEKALRWILQSGAGKLIKAARKYDPDLQPEQT